MAEGDRDAEGTESNWWRSGQLFWVPRRQERRWSARCWQRETTAAVTATARRNSVASIIIIAITCLAQLHDHSSAHCDCDCDLSLLCSITCLERVGILRRLQISICVRIFLPCSLFNSAQESLVCGQERFRDQRVGDRRGNHVTEVSAKHASRRSL